MELYFVCFECPKCNSQIYPAGHTSKAEPRYTRRFNFPDKNPPLDMITQPADVNLPNHATRQEIRDKLEQLRKSNPAQHDNITSQVSHRYQAWWNDFTKEIKARADEEENRLTGKVQNIARSEDDTGVTMDIERKPSNLEEDADGTARFKCPQCGRVLATAKPATRR